MRGLVPEVHNILCVLFCSGLKCSAWCVSWALWTSSSWVCCIYKNNLDRDAAILPPTAQGKRKNNLKAKVDHQLWNLVLVWCSVPTNALAAPTDVQPINKSFPCPYFHSAGQNRAHAPLWLINTESKGCSCQTTTNNNAVCVQRSPLLLMWVGCQASAGCKWKPLLCYVDHSGSQFSFILHLVIDRIFNWNQKNEQLVFAVW